MEKHLTDNALLEFPCRFPIKALGLREKNFDLVIIALIRKHAPDLGEGAVRSRASRAGKYLSVTVAINAVSQRQLDTIYRDLSGHDRVLMAL